MSSCSSCYFRSKYEAALNGEPWDFILPRVECCQVNDPDPENCPHWKTDPLLSQVLDRNVRFGLHEQGHLPLIEAMLQEGSSWDEIGRKIGWEPETARKFYEYEAKKGVS